MAEHSKQLLAKVSRPILESLVEFIDRACLRRDLYLDHVFAHEARRLYEEIPRKNSPKARAYLQTKLELLERVPVNFTLSPATVDAVNQACSDRNVVRDCFINRVLFLLVAGAKSFDVATGVRPHQDLSEILGDNDRDFLYAPLLDGSLAAVSGIVNSDPFQAIRNVIEYRRGQGAEDVEPLHACLILPEMFSRTPPGLIALNCYLPDEYIPDSTAAKRAHESLDQILGELINKPLKNPKPKCERKEAE